MDERDEFPDFQDEPAAPEPGASGPVLPGGVSVQTAATILLFAVVLAILWVFFGPQPEPTSDLPTATPGAASTTGTPAVAIAGTGTATAAPVAPETTPATAEAVASAAAVSQSTPPSTPPAGAPAGLADGGFVLVSGTGTYGLRLRFGPGVDFATVRIVDEGETLRISGAPQSEGAARWWRLQDRLGNVGWASGEFIKPVPAPDTWSPPAASPTFPPAGSG